MPPTPPRPTPTPFTRRKALSMLTGIGLAPVFTRVLADEAARATKTTEEMIAQAEWITGLSLNDEQRAQTAGAMDRVRASFDALRGKELDVSEAPAPTFFAEAPASDAGREQRQFARPVAPSRELLERPHTDDELALLTVAELGALLRAGRVTSMQLTELYLKRLRQYDEQLHCVVTMTEALAIKQAERADKELQAGRDRGPLHGIPWGAANHVHHDGQAVR